MPVNTAPNYTQIALNNPAARKGYAAVASKFIPKNAAGTSAATGWKAASGVKGGAIGIGTSIASNYLKTKSDPILDGGVDADIVGKYDRRLQDAGPGYASAIINRAGQGAQYGGWYGAAIGAGAGAVEAAVKKHAKSAYSDFLPTDTPGLINDAYRKYLDRDVEPGFVDAWMAGQGYKAGDKGVGQKQIFGLIDHIKNSPEAMAKNNPGVVSNNAPRQFTPAAIPSSFLSPEKVAMLDERRKQQFGY